jgi:hypothetical protein
MRRSSTITAYLDTWSNTKNQFDWSGILLGNGSSRALWEPFAYHSLFQRAASAKISHPLTATDKALFRKLGNTTNFENILGDLLTATTVNKALRIPHSQIPHRYRSIRRALIEAVHSVHLPWNRLLEGAKTRIRKALRCYSFVFTTNYDLLVYWCIMARDGNGFKDYFWNPTFDASDSTVWGSPTKILYLHGGLHLYRTASGRTVKEVGGVSGSLLDRFATNENRIPLFISEGSSHHKMQAIARSDYLSFGLKTLSEFDGSLVIFGHSLSTADKHIVAAINKRPSLALAYSIYPGKPSEIIRVKSRIIRLFPNASINFFDARTHPLGRSSLRIPSAT